MRRRQSALCRDDQVLGATRCRSFTYNWCLICLVAENRDVQDLFYSGKSFAFGHLSGLDRKLHSSLTLHIASHERFESEAQPEILF